MLNSPLVGQKPQSAFSNFVSTAHQRRFSGESSVVQSEIQRSLYRKGNMQGLPYAFPPMVYFSERPKKGQKTEQRIV